MVRHQIRHKKIAKCIFCPNPASTREHAWEDWAIQRIQTEPTVITGHIEGEELLVLYQKAIRIKCLCITCNTIWLKNLGERALPFIGGISQDIGIALDIPQQFVLAMWATSRAMVWEFIKDSARPEFYSDAHRHALRQNGSIPANTFIWLGRYGGTTNVGAWVSDYTKPMRSHITTLLYNRLLVQVLSVRPYPPDPPPIDIQPNRTVVRWPLAHAMIRPTERTAIWPPRYTIGSDVPLLDFLDRWNKHAPGELIAL